MKKEIAERVTQRIINQLEQGVVPWSQPWRYAFSPTSGSTGKTYRGWNRFLLGFVQEEEEYDTPYWYTYQQAATLGGNVRKGEKGTPVVLWKPMTKEVKSKDGETEAKSFWLTRTFTVFNGNQTEGFELPKIPEVTVEPPEKLIKSIVKDYETAPPIRHVRQDRAYYNVIADEITMPPFSSFKTDKGHASVLFHELVHSTGHMSRLNRFADGMYAKDKYAEEELVAELGAAMMRNQFGFECEEADNQSAAYVKGWLTVLRDDRSMIIKAAQKAQKAVDLITGETDKEEVKA